MIRRPPRSTRTDTLFPYTTLFRSSPPVIDAVHLDGVVLHLRVPAAHGDGMIQGGPRHILLELAVDLPDDLPALLLICRRGLRFEQRFYLLVAVSGIVANRIAGVVLIEVLRSEERGVGQMWVSTC